MQLDDGLAEKWVVEWVLAFNWINVSLY